MKQVIKVKAWDMFISTFASMVRQTKVYKIYIGNMHSIPCIPWEKTNNAELTEGRLSVLDKSILSYKMVVEFKRQLIASFV